MNKRNILFVSITVFSLAESVFSSLPTTASNTMPVLSVATNILPRNDSFKFSASLNTPRPQEQSKEEFVFANERAPLFGPESGHQTLIIARSNTATSNDRRQIPQPTDSQDDSKTLEPSASMIGTVSSATLMEFSMAGIWILIMNGSVLT